MADDPAQFWQERAERYRRSAAYYRTLIEQGEQQGEQPGGHGYPNWAQTKALLIKIAEGFEYDAREAEEAAR